MSRTLAVVGGTGPTGRGLAYRLARAGERIIIGSRDSQRAHQVAAEIARRAGPGSLVSGAENAEAVGQAEVVLLTIPFPGHAQMLKQLKPAFRPDAVLIDATVPLASTLGGRATRTIALWQGSAAEEAAEIVPKGVAVVAAFQNISAELLESDQTLECDVIICTDHDGAYAVAAELAEKIPGVRAVNGGRLEQARIVEQLTALLISINIRNKAHGAGIRVTGLPPKS